jgi:hypothetical protein
MMQKKKKPANLNMLLFNSELEVIGVYYYFKQVNCFC